MKNLYDIVCFDVDSTLVSCEGVDWLADQKGVGEKVRQLTEQAMSGEVAVEQVFSKKIDILNPTKRELRLLGEYYCTQIVEQAHEVISALQSAGLSIYLVTGGFMDAIEILAEKLGIPASNIHANDVYTDKFGNYQGINQKNCLTTSTGKAICAKKIGQGKRVAFVGDSVTDLATKPVVTTFIGYGGVVVRNKVKDSADFYIKSRSLEPLLWLTLD